MNSMEASNFEVMRVSDYKLFLAKREILSEERWLEIKTVLTAVFPAILFEKEDIPVLIELMKNDKKNFEGQIQCCILAEIGTCLFDQTVGEKELNEVFEFLLTLNELNAH